MKLRNLSVELGSAGAPRAPKHAPDSPFRILIMGDFSGRENRGIQEPLAGRRPVAVDCDSLDEALGRLRPALQLAMKGRGSARLAVRFDAVEDFHPDKLFDRLDLFAEVRDLRRRLQQRDRFEEAVRDMQRRFPSETMAPPAGKDAEAGAVSAPAENEDEMFQRLLGKAKSAPAARRPADGLPNLSALIADMVKTDVVEDHRMQEQALVRVLDAAAGEQMRSVLHHPDFQALESAWRGLDFLVRGLELNEELKLFVLDASKSEIMADLSACGEVNRTGLYDLLVEQAVGSPGAEPWGVVAGLYSFLPAREDAETLAGLAVIGQCARAPFLAAADHGSFRRLSSLASADRQAWDKLRSLPLAAWVGLAAPRFLLRLPYGKNTDAIERFEFEEAATPPIRENLIWGNPALACACLLGESFSESGWDFSAGDRLELGGLPALAYKEEGESRMTPCAEIWMKESEAEELMSAGLMPFLSIRGRDAIRLVRFQSIRQPPAALSGRWNE